ncbi:MAG TPA: PAS domain-containing sensor histidine kinase [Acidimicrobiales bacterium]|nr:PAS domain-containing sensor histidine kinase [Acidimicrobiales bacterium]
MSLTQAQLQFAAEFVTLVVTASALALLLLRPQPRRLEVAERDRFLGGIPVLQWLLSVVALAALAGASFAHGSQIVTGQDLQWIGFGRVVAAAVVLLAFPYPGGPRTGRTPVGGLLLRLGFLSWLVAGAVELGSGGAYITDALLVAGSLLAAGALLRVGRRSIAVRVAGSGAAALLLVVVVLALALSAVISSKVQNEELNRLSARSSVERSALTNFSTVSTDAQDVEAFLAASFPQPKDNPLSQFAAGTLAEKTDAGLLILKALNLLPPRADSATVAYSDPTGMTPLIRGQHQPLMSPTVLADPALIPGNCSVIPRGIYEIGGSMWLAAASPECTVGGQLLGAAIVAQPLDHAYLAARERIDPGVGLALVSGRTVYATAGMSPAQALAATAPMHTAPGQSVTAAVGDRFVSVAEVTASGGAGGTRPLDLVLSDRTNAALATRDQLFRTLFLIAFGGTVLALGLATFTGDRITAGLRRLTRAAAAISAGDATVRAGVAGDDEVASLGSAFDSMLDSVSAQSAALQAAAEDEARLRNRLQAVVAGMTDALVAVDSYGHITDFNQAAVELTGVAAAVALGAPAARIIRLNNEEGAPIGRRLLQPGGRSTAMMARVVRDDGEIPVAVSSGALRGPAGEAVGTVLVFRDMRREQEVEQMKTEFLSRIGHELRTPLTGILGYADILLRREVPEERARAWYEEILTSARRLLRIVEMLEFFASEGAGRMVLRPEEVDVRALVNGIASSWSGRLPPNLTIGRRLPKQETVVTADQRWLTLAVDELIDNAVKFSPEGGRILIKVAEEGDTVEISVSDQGMGMTSQHHDVIFGDFVQGDNSDTRRFGGLGLGLAVVRRVVEGHGGTINCRSAPGRGTTFVIGLPTRSADSDAAADGKRANGDRTPRRRRRAAQPSPTEQGGGL